MTRRAVTAMVCCAVPIALVGACNQLSGISDFQAIDAVDAAIPVVDSGPGEVPDTSVPEASPDTGGPALEPKRVFVTAETFTGKLGGRAGANEKCQQAALTANPALTGTWVAWLSTAGENAIDQIKHEGPYRLLSGPEVVANKEQLKSGALSHAINVNEHLVAYTENRGVWTGTLADGTVDATCNDWGDGTSAALGTLGSAVAKDKGWTKGAPQPSLPDNWECTASVALYCFEQ